MCRLPVTVVHQITLIVHHFNHLQENKNFVSVCLNQMLFGSVLVSLKFTFIINVMIFEHLYKKLINTFLIS